MKRAQAEKDGQWAQNTLDKNDKAIIAGRNGGLKSDNANSAKNEVEPEENVNNIGAMDSEEAPSIVKNRVENRKNILYSEKELESLNDRNQGKPAVLSQVNEGSSTFREEVVKVQIINEESTMKIEKSKINDPTKFSSKPNLNVILKRSLKDSLYSINMNGYYTNFETPQNDEKIKNLEMNPLVKNSLLLSEKVELEKKTNADKNVATTLPVYDSSKVVPFDDALNSFSQSDASICVEEVIDAAVTVVGGVMADSDAPLTGTEVIPYAAAGIEPHMEEAAVAAAAGPSQLEKAAVTVPTPAFSTSEVQQKVSTDDEVKGVVSLARDTMFSRVDESTRRALTTKPTEAFVESMKTEEATAAATPPIEGGVLQAAVTGQSTENEDGYGEGSVERLVQAQQAQEYIDGFSDPVTPSVAVPANPSADRLPSITSTSTPPSLFPPSPSTMSMSDTFSNPSTVPFCLLGDWDLAEQRYLSTDRYPTLPFFPF